MQYPYITLQNAQIKAKIYLPAENSGYYRGTRFDWSGMMHLENIKGDVYFGEWQSVRDPFKHDSVCGPVNEFEEINYNDTEVIDVFMKIGVGMLRKEEQPYSSFHTYEITNKGIWKVSMLDLSAKFEHTLIDKSGYAYTYRKKITIFENSSTMTVAHTLKNTGIRPIKTSVYNHNFFHIPNATPGGAISVRFPFELEIKEDLTLPGYHKIEGKTLSHIKHIGATERIFIPQITGFGTEISDNGFVMENSQLRIGVKVNGNKKIGKLRYWACETAACPEPFIAINLTPSEQFTWKYNYEFYNF